MIIEDTIGKIQLRTEKRKAVAVASVKMKWTLMDFSSIRNTRGRSACDRQAMTAATAKTKSEKSGRGIWSEVLSDRFRIKMFSDLVIHMPSVLFSKNSGNDALAPAPPPPICIPPMN